jgi:class 3 adenylate cyclase
MANVNETALDEKLELLEKARAWSPRIISKLETLIRTADDFSLFRLNPLQYAVEKSLSENEAIDLFLYAVKVALFEMEWHVLCPHCGYVVESLRSMSALHSHYRCRFCTVERDTSLDDYIQISFTISPQVREISFHHPENLPIEDFYFKYHLSRDVLSPIPGVTLAQAFAHLTKYMGYLLPGEKAVAEVELPPGLLRATDVNNDASFGLVLTPDEQADSQVIPLQLVNGKFQSPDPEMQPRTLVIEDVTQQPRTFSLELGRELANGNHTLQIENLLNRRSALWVFHVQNDPPPVMDFSPFLTGKKLLTTQTFHDLFRSETVRSDEGLSVQDITFLFTDLKGSTALYDAIGDPKAYYLVRQHFDTLGHAISQNNGAIVKTIGDAVMATFMNPTDAVQAALQMIQEMRTFNRSISHSLHLKVGIHRGHSIAVTLNDRLDYFGQTVNIAARVQSLADADEIYITEETFASLNDSTLLENYAIQPEQVVVKGVSDTLHVYKVTLRL